MTVMLDDSETLSLTDEGRRYLRYWSLPVGQRSFQEGVDIMPREPYTTGLAVLEMLSIKGSRTVGALRDELIGEFRSCREFYDSHAHTFGIVVTSLVRDKLVITVNGG